VERRGRVILSSLVLVVYFYLFIVSFKGNRGAAKKGLRVERLRLKAILIVRE